MLFRLASHAPGLLLDICFCSTRYWRTAVSERIGKAITRWSMRVGMYTRALTATIKGVGSVLSSPRAASSGLQILTFNAAGSGELAETRWVGGFITRATRAHMPARGRTSTPFCQLPLCPDDLFASLHVFAQLYELRIAITASN
jgi:hypothetical protein